MRPTNEYTAPAAAPHRGLRGRCHLLLRELRRSGYDVSHTRVETREELERALGAGPWDVIISDYSLPHFDGLSAFALVRQRGLDVPFLIVSGKIGEDVAVAAMKAGVHDFVLKDRLGRLGPAVARELREAELRAERRKMQEQLHAVGPARLAGHARRQRGP